MTNISNYYKELFVDNNNRYLPSNRWKISNYGLAIDKFGRFNSGKLDYIDSKGKNLYHIFKTNHKGILAYIQKKEKKIKTQLSKSNFEFKEIEISQNWRLVLNLGATTAYNNGFLLHPVYGIPYLADTAIKGMLRTYVIENYFDFEEEDAIKNEDFIIIFGQGNDNDDKDDKSVGKKGLVHFANAFPTDNDLTIEADIINNHHNKYYDDKNTDKNPVDTESPNVIKFITLKNASFSPYFYTNKQNKDKKISADSKLESVQGKSLLEAVQLLLLEAFEIKGIGAKTNRAYGRLKKKLSQKELDDKSENEFKKKLSSLTKKYSFDTLKVEEVVTAVIAGEKTAIMIVDGKNLEVQLSFARWIDKNSYKIGQLINATVKQISSTKKHIQIKIE